MKKPDQSHKEYYNEDWKRGFESGKNHSQPSPETKDFMEKTRLQSQATEQKVEYIKEKIDKMPTREEMLRCNKELLIDVMKDADKRYASKATEENLRWAIRIVVAIIITAVIGLVIYG